MTGALLFTCDGDEIAGAWGQDPAKSYINDDSALDLGTGLSPLGAAIVLFKSASPHLIKPGSDVTFQYLVTNPAASTLTNVVITDDNGTPGDTSDDFTLDSTDCPGLASIAGGGSVTCSTTRPVYDDITNVAYAEGDPPSGGRIRSSPDEDDVHIASSIGNYIWLDEDSDGYQDEGEAGIPNVRVTLVGTSVEGDPVSLQTYTDAQGGYLFDMLEPGTYYINVDEGTLPTGMTQTPYNNQGYDFGNQDHTDSDGGGPKPEGYEVSVGLNNPRENLTADFGYNWNPNDDVNNPSGSPTGTIGDRVWVDADGDGAQDAEEIGVAGVEVTLRGAGPDGKFGTGDDTSATTTTDANGNYIFDGLTPGVYEVEVTDDTGASHDVLNTTNYDQTGDPDQWGSKCTTCDNKTTAPIVLGPGDVFLNADFGYEPTEAALGSLGDIVWLDADGDGVGPNGNGAAPGSDNNEYGIPGVTVSLIQDTNGNGQWDAGEPIIATDVTDGNGAYQFDGLPLTGPAGDPTPGDANYLVWVNDTDNVLGELMPTYDKDGTAPLSGLASGLGISAATLSSGSPTDNAHDFGYAPGGHADTEGMIGDTIFLDAGGDGGQYNPGAGDQALEGVIVELYDSTGTVLQGTATTDENGRYYFGNLDANTTYTVKVASSNFNAGGVLFGLNNTFDPDGTTDSTSVVALNKGGANDGVNDPDGTGNGINLGQDFGYAPAAQDLGVIGDKVWYDADGDGVGPYGHGAAPGTDNAENGIPGVLVNLRDASNNIVAQATTDANGDYLFTGVPLGTYTVEIDASNFNAGGPLAGLGQTYDFDGTGTANRSTVTLTVGNPVRVDQDFGYRGSARNSIGDYVWGDVDGDGVGPNGNGAAPGTDNTEPGLAGVTVELYSDGPDGIAGTDDDVLVATEITDASGYYLFDDLPDDTYTVVVDTSTLPPGWQTPPSYDPDGGADSKSTLTVAGGTHNLVQDFGYPPTTEPPQYSIGDTIWFDVDADGVGPNGNGLAGNDPEPGLQGVTVNLYNDTNDNGQRDGGEPLVDSTVTDANGNYLFEGLSAGNYVVEVDTTTLPHWVTTSPSYDPDGLPPNEAGVAVGAGNPHPRTIDFGYPPEELGTGHIGNLVWNDVNADGVYQADGADGIPGTADDEGPIGGVTVDLYRDLNGNGQIDPGEPRIATTTTSSTLSGENGPDGNYLFENLPAGDYVVDVSDRDGVLAGYWHTLGTLSVDNNSQPDPYAVTLGGAEPLDDYSADFGYYVKPGALGNVVWNDLDADGFRDAGEPGIPDIEVQLTITYPDGTVVTLVTTTDSNGEYSFDNLLLDEDYNGDYSGSDSGEPTYTITVVVPSGATSTYDGSPDAPGVGNGIDDNADNTNGESGYPYKGGTDNSNDFGLSGPTGVELASFSAALEGGALQITWQTASEVDLLGFNLYRAEAVDGERIKVNDELIPTSVPPGSPTGAAYAYTDTGAAWGQSYVYWLEAVDIRGNGEWHGPVEVNLTEGPKELPPVKQRPG